MNIRVHVFVYIDFFISEYILKSGIAGSYEIDI